MLVRFWRWLWGGGDGTRAGSGLVPGGDIGGRVVFRFLLLIIPIATLIGIGYINFFYSFPSDLSPTTAPVATATGTGRPGTASPTPPTATRATATAVTRSSSLVATPAAGLGVFDPMFGDARRFLISLLIFIVAAIVETSLFLIYGAFYVNSPVNNTQPLGLPNGVVRVFLLILVVLVILVFAFLPSGWGENKAVTFLFGALSTVVGFYYGSHQDDTSSAPPVILTAMPNTLTFAKKAAEPDPEPKSISVTGLPTNTRLAYSIQVDDGAISWLKASPPSPTDIGILYVRVTSTVDGQSLSMGTHVGTISLQPEGASSVPTLVHVTFMVAP